MSFAGVGARSKHMGGEHFPLGEKPHPTDPKTTAPPRRAVQFLMLRLPPVMLTSSSTQMAPA